MSLQSQINQLRSALQALIDNSKKFSDYNEATTQNQDDIVLIEKSDTKEVFKIKIKDLQEKYFQLVSNNFYIDDDLKLWLNLSIYTQAIDFVGGTQIFTLDFEPTMFVGIFINGKKLMLSEYIYTSPNQLEILGTMEIGDSLEITYQHFIIEPQILE